MASGIVPKGEPPLTGRTALVTGSSRGIGRAIAVKLGELGADVAISRLDELEALFDRIRDDWGALDIFVNNAVDVASFGPVARLRPDAWRHTIDSHVTTFLVGSQRAAKLMKGRVGSIIALSSLGARVCVPGYAPIGVGKAAVEALTRYLAMELGPEGIRVNAVSAGPIDTDSLRRFSTFAEMEDASIRRSPGRRMGTPDDVADVVAFLCTEAARWICGQTIVVDGGFSLLGAH